MSTPSSHRSMVGASCAKGRSGPSLSAPPPEPSLTVSDACSGTTTRSPVMRKSVPHLWRIERLVSLPSPTGSLQTRLSCATSCEPAPRMSAASPPCPMRRCLALASTAIPWRLRSLTAEEAAGMTLHTSCEGNSASSSASRCCTSSAARRLRWQMRETSCGVAPSQTAAGTVLFTRVSTASCSLLPSRSPSWPHLESRSAESSHSVSSRGRACGAYLLPRRSAWP